MRSTTAEKPETTPIPVQLSPTEFHEFILPHLSMPKRGPQCKLGYHCLFNLILWVLYTGMQWKCLPVPKDLDGNRPFTTQTFIEPLPRLCAGSPPRCSHPVNKMDMVLF